MNGQATPIDVSGLSQNEIQGLLLGAHPSSQNIHVKREPEDLRKDPKCSRNQKVSENEYIWFFVYLQNLIDILAGGYGDK